MTSDRTEEQALKLAPIKATLFGKPKDIPVLLLGASMDWVAEWWAVVSSRQDTLMKADSEASAIEIMGSIFVGQPKNVLKLVCSYLSKNNSGITEDDLRKKSCSAEIDALFQQMCDVEIGKNPLVMSLANVMGTKKKSP